MKRNNLFSDLEKIMALDGFGLFTGSSAEFFQTSKGLARAADVGHWQSRKELGVVVP